MKKAAMLFVPILAFIALVLVAYYFRLFDYGRLYVGNELTNIESSEIIPEDETKIKIIKAIVLAKTSTNELLVGTSEGIVVVNLPANPLRIVSISRDKIRTNQLKLIDQYANEGLLTEDIQDEANSFFNGVGDIFNLLIDRGSQIQINYDETQNKVVSIILIQR